MNREELSQWIDKERKAYGLNKLRFYEDNDDIIDALESVVVKLFTKDDYPLLSEDYYENEYDLEDWIGCPGLLDEDNNEFIPFHIIEERFSMEEEHCPGSIDFFRYMYAIKLAEELDEE